MVLVWRIADDSSNSPDFPPAKLSHYTVVRELEDKECRKNNLIFYDVELTQLLQAGRLTLHTFVTFAV